MATFFLSPQLRRQKCVTWAKPRPFYGWSVFLLTTLNIVSLCRKFESSSFSHSWDMDGSPKIYNVSRDVTTPLSGTTYHQPIHQIWSLYLYSLRRYERRQKMQKLGWFGGLGVTQGHRKHSHSIECIWLLFDFNRNYASILYRYRVIARFSSKVTNFNPPCCQKEDRSPIKGAWFCSRDAFLSAQLWT